MIKKLLLIVVLFCTAFVFGQVVRVGLLGGGEGPKSSAYHLLDINYAPTQQYDLGMFLSIRDSENSNFYSYGPYVGVQGKYYFLSGKIKPFVGLQIGSSLSGAHFLVVPQVGIRLGPFEYLEVV